MDIFFSVSCKVKALSLTIGFQLTLGNQWAGLPRVGKFKKLIPRRNGMRLAPLLCENRSCSET